jgi:hypothetical protein
MTAVHLLNRLPTKALNGKAPYEAWHGCKPMASHLRVFDCLTFTKELNHIGKLDNRSTPGVFIGYAEGIKAYRILDPVTQHVRISRDIVFDEGRGWAWDKAVDDGSTLILRDFVVDYVHFEGAEELAAHLHRARPPQHPARHQLQRVLHRLHHQRVLHHWLRPALLHRWCPTLHRLLTLPR